MSADTPPDSGLMARPARTGTAPIARGAGAFICLAAGLKLFDLFDSFGEGIVWALGLVGASVELAIGAALVLGLWPTISVPLGGLLFLLLAAVSLIGTGRSAAECGCLGSIPMPPWVMLIIDAAAAAALLWRPLSSGRVRSRPILALDVACIGLFFIGTTIGSMVYPRYMAVTTPLSEELIAAHRLFTIAPSRFLGQPFFLKRFIRIDADLTQGRWKVILTRPHCRKCDRMLRTGGCRPDGDERVAIVVARGRDEAGRAWAPPAECEAVLGELSPDKTWDFVPPMIFRLDAGKVVAIR